VLDMVVERCLIWSVMTNHRVPEMKQGKFFVTARVPNVEQ
jgi:hypothetical protein